MGRLALKGALPLLLALAVPAQARLAEAGPDAFVSAHEAVIPQGRESVFAALVNWGAWWDPAHSYSGKPGAITLELPAGGLLSERWPGGDVVHAQVINAMPPALLRLQGSFGPLQALPVNAVLEFSLKAQGNATRLTMTYRVAGSATFKLDTLAAPVDAVMSAGFARLVNFAATGKP